MKLFIHVSLFAVIALSSICFADQEGPNSNTTQPTPTEIYVVGDIIESSTTTYKVISELGEGVFGKVFAVENANGQKFAMKTYKASPEIRIPLYLDANREFMRGQLLDSPNIIKSFELFPHTLPDQQISNNLILQLVDGKPIFDTKRATFSKETALQAAIHFCEAIDYARSMNFVHLDLHNGNVMLTTSGDVMIIDLASFFTYDEVFKYVETKTTDLSPTQPAQESPMVQAQKLYPLEAVAGNQKLEQFFKMHPRLFARMQEAVRLQKRMPMRQMLKSSDDGKQATTRTHMTPMHSYYFESISNICLSIIEKSNINRDDKINMRVEIKKLVWNFFEDVEEGKSVPLEFYFDQLLNILKTTPCP